MGAARVGLDLGTAGSSDGWMMGVPGVWSSDSSRVGTLGFLGRFKRILNDLNARVVLHKGLNARSGVMAEKEKSVLMKAMDLRVVQGPATLNEKPSGTFMRFSNLKALTRRSMLKHRRTIARR